MAEQTNDIEQQVEALILAGLAHSDGNRQDTTTQEGTEERTVLDVDLYRLEGGAVLLVPNIGTNPLDINTIDSKPPAPKEQGTPVTETPPVPQTKEEPQEGAQAHAFEPAPAAPGHQRERLLLLIPLVLVFMLFGTGSLSYVFLLPLTAQATITIVPKERTLHTDTTFPITQSPNAGQVQGRSLAHSSLTQSKTVPATGHAHDDATSAAGVLTFYNADSQSYTISAGTSFSLQSVTVVTDTPVIVQAAVPPSFGIGITQAHVIQAGSAGNIAAHTIDTRCCGSQFVTATNTSAFSGGQDARSYSFIQSSDIHNAASDLLGSLTPQASAALHKEIRPGEQLVTPLCSPRTHSSTEAGSEGARVTVSVTQTCRSVAYLTDSLNQVATSTLTRSANLTRYEQAGTTQVTVNGSTYTNQTARLTVSLSGTWIYRFTQAHITQLTRHLAGESQQQAQATLAKGEGIAQASIHLQRFDGKDSLPIDPQRISVQFLYLVS